MITASLDKSQLRSPYTELAINPVGGLANLWVAWHRFSSSSFPQPLFSPLLRWRNKTHGPRWSWARQTTLGWKAKDPE